MDIKKFSCLMGLALAFIFFIANKGWAEAKPGTKAPFITNAYAVEKGYYGSVLKIYIEGEDPDGDMLRIATVVEQVGYGYYPSDWIYLKPQNQKSLKGYIQWNTFSSRTSYLREWTQITLKISVFDKAGNESNEVTLPFVFVTGARPESKLPPTFSQGDLPRLGYVHIDLFEPTLMGAGLGNRND